MVARGDWRATERGELGTRSYWYNALYGPFRTMGDLAAELVDARDDETRLKDVQQASQVIPWTVDVPDRLTRSEIVGRCQDYQVRTVPEEVEIITGGIDVGKRVLYYAFRGWAHARPYPYSWLIDYGVVDRLGPNKALSVALGQIADRASDGWLKPDGEIMHPSLILVDSGYEADGVYGFVRGAGQQRWLAYKGAAGARVNEFKMTKQPESGVILCVGNADIWKTKVHTLLKVREPDQPGYFALPSEIEYYYGKHLTAEEWHETAMEKGKVMQAHWHQLRTANHMFDCEAMAALAARIRGVFGEPRRKRVSVVDGSLAGSGVGDLVSSVLKEYG